MHKKIIKKHTAQEASFFALGAAFLLFFFLPASAYAARLELSPAGGAFTVGSTFNVQILLDTDDESVNAFEISLRFPPDVLQLVSPSTGKSITQVWTGAPTYDNASGVVELEGGIPGGVTAAKGLITTLTFRAKQVGHASVKFGDESRVLLNDGKGTDGLRSAQSGIYEFVLPPPAGPVVASETHSDQSAWYPNRTAILLWEGADGVRGYSYVLNEEPVAAPDDISEGAKTSIAYKNLSDGTHYFHVKALRGDAWGGISHYGLNVDAEPPAEFPIKISPESRTSSRNPIVSYETSDAHSGMSHYEYKVVSLTPGVVAASADSATPFFIEAPPPQPLDLALGSYDVIVRAYDSAGNFRESVERLEVVTPLFRVVGDRGVRFFDAFTVPWLWIVGAAVLLAAALGGIAWKVRVWHHGAIERKVRRELPEDVEKKLGELEEYRRKYGKVAVVFLLLASFAFGPSLRAEEVGLVPPYVSTVSREISNEEIFYIGGKADASGIDVIVYLQNLTTGETRSEAVASDDRNEWFYRHDTFLPSGNYLLWTQARAGDELSPPSPQIQMRVQPTAFQFGASRLSYETAYLFSTVFLLLIVFVLLIYIGFHFRHGRKRHREFLKEVREAEESVRRGFAVLKRDIEAELAVVRKAKLSKELSEEEKKMEEELLRDLAWAEQYIGKEVWDIERTAEHHH